MDTLMADPEVKAALQDPFLAAVWAQMETTVQMVLDGQVNPDDLIPGLKQQFQSQPKVLGFILKVIGKITGGGTDGMNLWYARWGYGYSAR